MEPFAKRQIGSIIADMRLLIMASMLALLAACAPQWSKPGATSDDIRADASQCEAMAYSQVPAQATPQALPPAYPPDPRYLPTGSVAGIPSSIPSQPNAVQPSLLTGGRPTDANAAARTSAFDQCMSSKGYTRSGS